MDLGTDYGRALREEMGVRVTPTFFLVAPGGEDIAGWVGYGDPESWVAKVREVRADPVTRSQREARFAATPAVGDALALGELDYGKSDYAAAAAYFGRALEIDRAEAVAGGALMQRFRALFRAARVEKASPEQVLAAFDALCDEPGADPDHLFEAGYRLAGVVEDAGVENVGPRLTRLMDLTASVDDPDLAGSRRDLEIAHALIVLQDKNKAFDLKLAGQPEGWLDDPSALNEMAWWCVEQTTHLVEAESWARGGVELADGDGMRANILDTLAEVQNLRGFPAAGLATLRRALALSPDNEYLQGQVAKFERLLGG